MSSFSQATLASSHSYSELANSLHNDSYQLSRSGSSSLNRLLNGLSPDVNLQLLHTAGTMLHSSSASCASAEVMSIDNLAAGNSSTQIRQATARSNDNKLSVSTTSLPPWAQQLGTSGLENSTDVAVDSAGNVYLTGYTDGSLGGTNAGSTDAYVAKYSSSGTLLWTRQLGTSSSDYSNSVAVDSTGNIYITGYTGGALGGTSAGGSDTWVAKYDSSGTQLWTRQLGTSSSDYSSGVAVDSTGNVYITGYTGGALGGTFAGGSDGWIAKYNSSGTQLWTRQLGTSSYDYSFGVAVDSTGNVYITGYTDGALGGTYAGGGDAYVAKYNSSGTLLGKQQIGTSAYDYTSSIAVDSAGYVYIAGQTYGSLQGTSAGSNDAWVFAKFNSPTLTTDNAGNTLSTARSITVDSTTSTYSDFIGTTDTNDYYRFSLYSRSTINLLVNALSADANLQLLDSNGVAIVKSSNSGTSAESISRTLEAGTYYIRVYPSGSANTNYNLSVSATPVLEWTRQMATSGNDEAHGVAVDSAGNVYTTGRTNGSLGGTNAGNYDAWLTKHDSSGNLLWTRQLGTSSLDESYDVAVDSAGNVYIAGETGGALGGTYAGVLDAWVAKYNSSGTLLWTRQLGTSDSDQSYGVAVDSAGNVYLTGRTYGALGGTSAGSNDAWVAKYNSSGTQLWTRQLGTSSDEYSQGIAVDSSGNVYITGETQGSLGGTFAGESDAWVAKYDSSGTRLWTRQLGTASRDSSYGVAVDSAGNVYLTGDTRGALGGTNAGSNDAWVAKYNSNGTRLWIQQFGTSEYDDSYGGIAVDSAGNVYVSGETEGSLGGAYAGMGDGYVAKFNSSGTQLWTQQFGTSQYEFVYDIAVDRFDNLYLAGETEGSLGGTYAGGYDAWVFAKFTKDIAGNTLATASNLGTLSGSRTYSNFIDAVGTNDYYKFNLSTTSNFNLLLSGLIADAEVQLFDSNGVAIASSTNTGTEAESINTTLTAGTYYIRIYGYDPLDIDVNTTYALNLTVS